MPFVQTIPTRVKALWNGLPPAYRAIVVVIAAVGLVVATYMVVSSPGPRYTVAFTQLDPSDSAAVVKELDAQKIPYQLQGGGTTILVSSGDVARARLMLASKGLPAGGTVGYELFDKTNFGVTDFVQHVNYQRALEGEIERSINLLDAVQSSKVNIVVPREALFQSDQKPATASVVLRLRAGRTLDQSRLRGIAHLVARSVEGLDEKNVTVVDTSGQMLYDGGQTFGGNGTQLALQRDYEQNLETKLQQQLDTVLGPGKSAVTVAAALDFTQVEQNAETYQPVQGSQGGVVLSQQQTQETFNGTGGTNGGVPGSGSNIPPIASPVAGSTGPSSYQRTETTTNYDVSKVSQKTVDPPGRLKRLSVSVVLDSSVPQQQAQALQQSLAAAAGIDPDRGDVLTVTTQPFVKQQAVTAGGRGLPIMDFVKLGVPLLAAVLALFFLGVLYRNLVRHPALALPQRIVVAASPDTPALQHGERAAEIEEPRRPDRREMIERRVLTLAKNSPESVAEIVQSWLVEERK